MGRSSLQGTPWHVIYRWQLKELDESTYEVKDITKKRKKKQKKKKKYISNNNNRTKEKIIQSVKKDYKGKFVLKFDGEEPEEFIIGKNISKDAKIVEIVFSSSVGKKININGEEFIIIKKNIHK